MQLYGLLADEARGLPDIGFGARDRAAPLGCIGVIDLHRRNDGHRARLFRGDDHLRHAVLEGLKRADGHAELLAGLQVIQRRLVERRHDTQGLGAKCGNGAIHRPLDDPERPTRLANHGIGTDGDVVEDQVTRPAPGLRGIGEQCDTRSIPRYEKQRNPIRVGQLTRAACGH